MEILLDQRPEFSVMGAVNRTSFRVDPESQVSACDFEHDDPHVVLLPTELRVSFPSVVADVLRVVQALPNQLFGAGHRGVFLEQAHSAPPIH